MKKFIDTLKNIWKIEDLRTRILITTLFVAIYRFGSKIVLPGVNFNVLEKLNSGDEKFGLADQTSTGLMSLLDMFSGGAFSQASIFALGIMPYISASIVMQLLAIVVPYFQKMQREGESGRKKINQYTRYLTIAILLFQAPSYLVNMRMQIGQLAWEGIPAFNPVLSWGLYMALASIMLAAGSMFILWLGERITDKGIGNGVSLIIMIGIIARLPGSFAQEVGSRFAGATGGGLVMFLIEIIILYAVVCASIVLVQGVRKVPVQYAKRVVGNKQYGGARQYIPLKLFAANVMPIIFAQALMFIPLAVAQYADKDTGWFMLAMRDQNWLYYLIYTILIIAFTYFYTAITLNPTQMAEDMKRNNGFIPGVKPGKDTADYIDTIMSRITLPGSLFIAFIAVMPAFAGLLGVQKEFSQFFGGTSLLILVGVVLDTLQQIESHLLMRHYDGLLNSGRIHGRGGVAAY
ncbi:MAG: preprotein translocase subunit SecY [Prevotella sp.]|nr:preprotein translocase subunit SecY [Prevotella sp.]